MTWLLLVLVLLAGDAQAATYRWVDDQGRVHYGDTLPAQAPRKGSTELSKQGNVVRHREGWMTPEERRANDALQAQKTRDEREAQDRARRDRALLATYTSEAEIDLMRDRNVEQEELAIRSIEGQLKPAHARVDQLRAQAARVTATGRPLSVDLQQNLAQAEAALARLNDSIALRRRIIQDLRARADADKSRFRELTEAMKASSAGSR